MTDRSNAKHDQPTAESAAFKLKDYKIEDYVVLILFWALTVVVFAQFFSRYVMNSAIVWTEEIARYLLIVICFLGSGIASRKGGHIAIEAAYRLFPRGVGRALSILVDILTIAFNGIGTYLAVRILPVMMEQRLTTVRLSMGALYIPVLLGFVLMTFRSLQVAWRHWKSGYVPGADYPSAAPPID
jgi:TRAP-type C4-dicarboxylate transport system permease small subunit